MLRTEKSYTKWSRARIEDQLVGLAAAIDPAEGSASIVALKHMEGEVRTRGVYHSPCMQLCQYTVIPSAACVSMVDCKMSSSGWLPREAKEDWCTAG